MKIHLSQNIFPIACKWILRGLSCTLKTPALHGQSPWCGESMRNMPGRVCSSPLRGQCDLKYFCLVVGWLQHCSEPWELVLFCGISRPALFMQTHSVKNNRWACLLIVTMLYAPRFNNAVLPRSPQWPACGIHTALRSQTKSSFQCARFY